MKKIAEVQIVLFLWCFLLWLGAASLYFILWGVVCFFLGTVLGFDPMLPPPPSDGLPSFFAGWGAAGFVIGSGIYWATIGHWRPYIFPKSCSAIESEKNWKKDADAPRYAHSRDFPDFVSKHFSDVTFTIDNSHDRGRRIAVNGAEVYYDTHIDRARKVPFGTPIPRKRG